MTYDPGNYPAPDPNQPNDPYGTTRWTPPQRRPWPPQAAPLPGPFPPVSGPGYPLPPGQFPPPPMPPQPRRKPRTALIVLGVVGGVLALICAIGAIGAALSPSKPVKVADPMTPATAAGQATNNPTGAAAPAKAAGLNTPVRDGQLEFTVTAVKYGITEVGDSFMNKQAQGQFAEVSVMVKNIGNEPRTFDGSSQTAYGVGNVKYEDDTSAEIYANTDDQTFLNDINPGNQIQGVLIFDIPKGSKLTKIELHDSFLSGGATVQLG